MKKKLLHRYCEGVTAIPTANFLVICVEIIPYNMNIYGGKYFGPRKGTFQKPFMQVMVLLKITKTKLITY